MTETQLKTKCQKYLTGIGAFHFKLSDTWRSGIPDMYVAYKGRAILIELKTGTGIVSELQRWHINMIEDHGCEAYVVRSLEELKKIMEDENE